MFLHLDTETTELEILRITETDLLRNAYIHSNSVDTFKEVYEYRLRNSASYTPCKAAAFVDDSTVWNASSLRAPMSIVPLGSLAAKRSSGLMFRKWETTIESISYVTTKTVEISEYPPNKGRNSDHCHTNIIECNVNFVEDNCDTCTGNVNKVNPLDKSHKIYNTNHAFHTHDPDNVEKNKDIFMKNFWDLKESSRENAALILYNNIISTSVKNIHETLDKRTHLAEEEKLIEGELIG